MADLIVFQDIRDVLSVMDLIMTAIDKGRHQKVKRIEVLKSVCVKHEDEQLNSSLVNLQKDSRSFPAADMMASFPPGCSVRKDVTSYTSPP